MFLDEIGTLSYTAQGKLLRALQEGEIERVGDSRVRKVDVRVIAATNVNLRDAVKDGSFREDLFYRLNVFPIRVPPLRDRRDDIPLLMNWFMQRSCKKNGKTITGFRERAVDALINYRWPGNVREMENLIERAVILADDGGALDICHLFTTGEELNSTTFIVQKNGALRARGRCDRNRCSDLRRRLADAGRHRGAHAAARAGRSQRQPFAGGAAAQHQPPDAGLSPAQAQDRGGVICAGATRPAAFNKATAMSAPRRPA